MLSVKQTLDGIVTRVEAWMRGGQMVEDINPEYYRQYGRLVLRVTLPGENGRIVGREFLHRVVKMVKAKYKRPCLKYGYTIKGKPFVTSVLLPDQFIVVLDYGVETIPGVHLASTMRLPPIEVLGTDGW